MPDRAPPNALRVLVVDDRRDTVLLLQTLLARAGHQVMTADNGTAALEAMGRFAPQVVISDLGLGGPIDGFALVKALRSNSANKSPCCIAVTGYDDDAHRQQAREAGFDHYLVKPVPIAALLALFSGIAADDGIRPEAGRG